MIRAVFDTSTVVAAIFWPKSTARRAWTTVARRKAQPCVTEQIEFEYRETCLAFQQMHFPSRSPEPFLDWISRRAHHCVPTALGKQRSRDAKDDPFIACALSAEAMYIVSSDRDLLDLEKPFGISIVTPSEFLKQLGR
jgi:uncharacterized protein